MAESTSQSGATFSFWNRIQGSDFGNVNFRNQWPTNHVIILNRIVVSRDATKDTESHIRWLLRQHAVVGLVQPSKFGYFVAPFFEILQLGSPDMRSDTPILRPGHIVELLDSPVVHEHIEEFLNLLSWDDGKINYVGVLRRVAPCLAANGLGSVLVHPCPLTSERYRLTDADPRTLRTANQKAGRCILKILEDVYGDSDALKITLAGPTFQPKTRSIQWLQDPDRVTVNDQIWILYHVLYLYQDAEYGIHPLLRATVTVVEIRNSKTKTGMTWISELILKRLARA